MTVAAKWLGLCAAVVLLGWFLTRPETVDPAELQGVVPDPANGERLFHAGGCSACHGADLGGGLALETDFGTFYAPNISTDELSGIGEMEAGVMGSYAQMVCDNDIAASVRRALRGFSVDEDSLAVEVIGKVMNGSHNYIAERHSVKYLRSGEILFPELCERRAFAEWDRTGRNGLAENAQAQAERLLAEHQVPPLEDAQERELDKIMQAASKELIKT